MVPISPGAEPQIFWTHAAVARQTCQWHHHRRHHCRWHSFQCSTPDQNMVMVHRYPPRIMGRNNQNSLTSSHPFTLPKLVGGWTMVPSILDRESIEHSCYIDTPRIMDRNNQNSLTSSHPFTLLKPITRLNHAPAWGNRTTLDRGSIEHSSPWQFHPPRAKITTW